jgi:hypothetical protein
MLPLLLLSLSLDGRLLLERTEEEKEAENDKG